MHEWPPPYETYGDRGSAIRSRDAHLVDHAVSLGDAGLREEGNLEFEVVGGHDLSSIGWGTQKNPAIGQVAIPIYWYLQSFDIHMPRYRTCLPQGLEPSMPHLEKAITRYGASGDDPWDGRCRNSGTTVSQLTGET